MDTKTPAWTPLLVRQFARYVAATTPDMPQEAKNLLVRLMTDDRMEGVWNDLRKNKREGHIPTAESYYQGKLPDAVGSWSALAEAWRARAQEYRALGDLATAIQYEHRAALANALPKSSGQPENISEQQERERVLVVVFGLAFSLYCAGFEMVKKADLEDRSNALEAKGRAEDAGALRHQAQSPDNAPFIVSRKRGDQRIHAFVEGMAKEFAAMFDQDMPGIIATITNVTFERSDYTRDRIRALLKVRG